MNRYSIDKNVVSLSQVPNDCTETNPCILCRNNNAVELHLSLGSCEFLTSSPLDGYMGCILKHKGLKFLDFWDNFNPISLKSLNVLLNQDFQLRDFPNVYPNQNTEFSSEWKEYLSLTTKVGSLSLEFLYYGSPLFTKEAFTALSGLTHLTQLAIITGNNRTFSSYDYYPLIPDYTKFIDNNPKLTDLMLSCINIFQIEDLTIWLSSKTQLRNFTFTNLIDEIGTDNQILLSGKVLNCVKSLQQLERLNLLSYWLTIDSSLILESILKNGNLKHFGIQLTPHTNFTKTTARGLTEAFAKSTTRSVGIYVNSIGTAKLLSQKTNLDHLYFYALPVGKTGANIISNNLNLTSLQLRLKYPRTVENNSEIFDALKKHEKLKHIMFGALSVEDTIAKEIQQTQKNWSQHPRKSKKLLVLKKRKWLLDQEDTIEMDESIMSTALFDTTFLVWIFGFVFPKDVISHYILNQKWWEVDESNVYFPRGHIKLHKKIASVTK